MKWTADVTACQTSVILYDTWWWWWWWWKCVCVCVCVIFPQRDYNWYRQHTRTHTHSAAAAGIESLQPVTFRREYDWVVIPRLRRSVQQLPRSNFRRLSAYGRRALSVCGGGDLARPCATSRCHGGLTWKPGVRLARRHTPCDRLVPYLWVTAKYQSYNVHWSVTCLASSTSSKNPDAASSPSWFDR